MYSIIMPDGATFQLEPTKYIVDFGIPSGFGLPDVQHMTQMLYNQPGAQLNAIAIQPRLVTITAKLNADCRDELHQVRNRLWQALRWNRTTDDPPAPAVLRYDNNGVKADLHIYYLGDDTTPLGTDDKIESLGVRLIAYDPFWYGENHESQEIPSELGFAMSYVAAKINGIWDNLENPAASAGVGGPDIRAIAFSPDGNTVYFAGNFTNWDGNGNADRIVAFDMTLRTWSALGTGMNGVVYGLVVIADGTLIAVGGFTTAGGNPANYIAQWNGSVWSALSTGLDNYATCVVLDETGNSIYVGGAFANAGGNPAATVAKWNGSSWSALGSGTNGTVNAMACAPDGALYICGSFGIAGGGSAPYIAKWDGANWSALGSGMNNSVYALAIGANGLLYAGGSFTLAGGVNANYVAKWNGYHWSAMGNGMASDVFTLAIDSRGEVFAGGMFSTVPPYTDDNIAIWNGSAWSGFDINLPSNPVTYVIEFDPSDNLFIGTDTSGNAIASYISTLIDYAGDVETFPIFTIRASVLISVSNPTILRWIENVSTGKRMWLNLTLSAGEIVTIDLRSGIKSITSNWRGNLLPYAAMLPQSDFASFSIDPAGGNPNLINIKVENSTYETGDNNNQLSDYINITSVTSAVLNAGGQLYVSIISDGGGFYHINLYSDVARSYLVGHTASYNAIGAKAIVADNASGLGGTVMVDSIVAADADIIVYFSRINITWDNRFLSADVAVQ